MSDAIKRELEKSFGEPIHIPLRDYLEKVIAGTFMRQPDMSGDARKRLNRKERDAVSHVALNILLAMSGLEGDQP